MAYVIERPDIDLILAMIRQWVDLLANKDFENAANYLVPIPRLKRQYDPTTLEEALGRYSRRYREAPDYEKRTYLPIVSPLREMRLEEENMTIYKTGTDPLVIEYDMPIERKWSDLTAKFQLVQLREGFGLGLIDLHVL
jgi:hypothetical protein